jgi:hypothetical protein
MRGNILMPMLAGLLAVLSGCGATAWQTRPVPYAGAGAELELRQPVTFPAGVTRVYFQDGRMTDARGITVWEQHCALALDRGEEADREIPAQRLPVVSTQRRSSIDAASRGVVTYENSFLFAASARPLYALYCEIWVIGDSLGEHHHIDAGELARVLGEWATLRPARPRE